MQFCVVYIQYLWGVHVTSLHTFDIHEVCMWCPCGIHAMPMRCPCDAHVVYMQYPWGVHVTPVWYTCNMRCTCDAHVIYIRYPWGVHVVTMWYTCNSMWYTCNTYEVYMWHPCIHSLPMKCTIMWYPCDIHALPIKGLHVIPTWCSQQQVQTCRLWIVLHLTCPCDICLKCYLMGSLKISTCAHAV